MTFDFDKVFHKSHTTISKDCPCKKCNEPKYAMNNPYYQSGKNANIVINIKNGGNVMAEKEYIERNVLVETLNRLAPQHYDCVINGVIMVQDTADVAPIKHGHWILTKRTKIIPTDKIGLKEIFTICKNGTLVDENNINKKAMIIKKRITIIKPKCSECGYYGFDEDDITPYCPCCGAKMDEDEGDNTE